MNVIFALIEVIRKAASGVKRIRNPNVQEGPSVGQQTSYEMPDFSPPAPEATASAIQLLQLVRQLRNDNAQWPKIVTTIYHRNDEGVESALIALRGPHRFLPHVALNILEEGCQRALTLNPSSDDLQALREALKSAGIVLHFGN